MIKAVVTDIEGTTTSISFVYDTLFPYARREMEHYIQQHGQAPLVREQLNLVLLEAGRPLTDEQAIQQLKGWMDEDKKITPLKTLQGLIWEDGYREGRFRGHVYDDVPFSLQHWHDIGISLYVYSSGSVQAQKLLFGHSDHGDLTPLFSGYFDTRIGNKRESESYRRIAEAIGQAPEEILFLSDIEQELAAADLTGMKTLLLARDRNITSEKFLSVHSFDEIDLSVF